MGVFLPTFYNFHLLPHLTILLLIGVYKSSLKYMHTQHALTKSIIYMCPTRNYCIAGKYFHNERKWHWWKWIKEVLKWRRQKTKSTYFAKN